nr:integrase, catalytic region, zinc finger, CCHC-type, peptidase aspartic, catalytic [Tanacetum cinerariifolium]
MSTQHDIYAARSENRPLMLNKENYVSWSSRLLRFAKSRPNGKLIHNSIINGPYVRRMIPEPGDTNREVSLNETFHVQTDDELTEKELKQIEADDQAIQTILLGLLEDIYTANKVDELKAERLAKTQDPLALMASSNNPYTFPMLHQDQPSFNQNYMQQPMPNPEDITDPTTAMNMALALMAKAFKLNYSTPTNNNQRISSNLHNRLFSLQFRTQKFRMLFKGMLIRIRMGMELHCQAKEKGCCLSSDSIADCLEGRGNGSAEVHNYENCYDDEIFNMFTQEEQYTELLEPIPEPRQVPQNDNNVISKDSSMEQSGGTVEQQFSDDTTPSVACKFLNEVKSTIVTLQRVVKHRMTLETYNWSSSAHQELHKIVKDEIFHIVNQVDARVQNFEIQFLKKAAKFVGDFKSFAKEADESLAKHKALELEIERLLRAVVNQDIMSVVQNNSVVDISNLQTELERDWPGMFRINPFKTSREDKHVPNKDRISIRTKPITVSQHPVFTKKDINSDSNGLSSTGVDNTKTRRSQPRSNTKNDRVLSASKGSQSKNKEVEVEEHHRNLLLSKNKNHMSSACNKVKFDSQNVISKVVCAMCKQCLIFINHHVCLHNYVYGKTSRGKKQKANVSINEKQKKQHPKVKKIKKVGFIERLATPKPSKPRFFLRWSPTGRLFDLKGKIIASIESESQSDCSNGYPNLFMFLGTVRFENVHVAAILGFGDLQWGNILITRVYFVEGLGHNLFSVGQFCDSNLEVAFRRNKCFVRNLKGVDLLKGNHTINLYTINLYDMASASLICLMARASSTKSWLWHQRLSHLNFDTINDLAKNDLVSGLPKFKYHKEHLCPSCEKGKSKRASHPPKPVPNSRQRKPDISFLHVFGALCYPKNDREDIGKLGAKGDVGFFIGYSADSCAYRVFNRRTKKVMETMNVSFDELSAMAFEQRSSKPELQNMTPRQISSGLDLTYASSTITTQQPSEGELDLLFEAMYDNFIGGQSPVAQRSVPAAQAQQVRQTSTTSTSIADTASTPTSSSSQASNFPISSHDVDELNSQKQHVQQQRNQAYLQSATVADNVSNAMFDENTFVNPFATPSTREPSRPVLTRNQLRSDGDICMYALTFKRLDVWVLVPTPDKISPLTFKWLFKNKHDEEQTVIRNKSRLVVRGYRQEEGIDFEESFASVLYGLKQAPRAWYDELLMFLLQNHFFKGTIDRTLFIRRFDDDILVVQVYVDDIIFGSTHPRYTQLFSDLMKSLLEMSMMEEMTFFLGSQVNQSLCGIFINQSNYVLEILKKYEMESCDLVDFGFELTGFLDADYTGCKDTFKSIFGGAQFLAIAISCNLVQHSRTKRIAVRYHFIKEHVEKGTIELYFFKTDYQLADQFTKALPVDRFNYLVRRLGMRSLSPQELDRLAKSQ